MSRVESAREQRGFLLGCELRGNGGLDDHSVSLVDDAGAQAGIQPFALKGAGEPAGGPEPLLSPVDPS